MKPVFPLLTCIDVVIFKRMMCNPFPAHLIILPTILFLILVSFASVLVSVAAFVCTKEILGTGRREEYDEQEKVSRDLSCFRWRPIGHGGSLQVLPAL